MCYHCSLSTFNSSINFRPVFELTSYALTHFILIKYFEVNSIIKPLLRDKETELQRDIH